MQLQATLEIWKKGNWYIASCPQLDFVTQGTTAEEARGNLIELIDIQFEQMRETGVLEDYLTESGFEKEGDAFVAQAQRVSLEEPMFKVA